MISGLNAEILYNIAAGLGFIAYLMSNILWLRMILVVGALFYIITGLLLNLNSMIGWHIAYALINLFYVVYIFIDNSATTLPMALRDLYADRFTSLKPREFKRIIDVNPQQTICAPNNLFTEGDKNDTLILIRSGNVAVEKQGKYIASLGPGDFVGEMSVLSGNPVSSDVLVQDELKYFYWTLKDLRKIEAKNLSLYNRFMMAAGRSVIEKLHSTTAKNAAPNES